MRRQRNRKIGVQKKRSSRPRNQKQSLGEREHVLDSYDVREWFAADPAACVSDIAAQKVLRGYEHPFRWWITFPVQEEEGRIRSRFEKLIRSTVERRAAHRRSATRASIEKKIRESAEKGIRKQMLGLTHRAGEALVADQFTPWWQSLQNHLSVILPEEVVDRFTHYLSGYLLVLENETPRSSATWEDRNKKTNDTWRQLKRFLPKLNGGPGDLESMLPASATPPQQEGLKTKLIRVMSEDLVALGYSRDIIAYTFLPFVWDAVDDKILARSFLRTERRSRHRTSLRK